MDSAFDLGAAFAGRLALGDPDHVPAGIYARQALQSLGWWQQVEDRLAPAPDVRIALTYVARGECALGVTFATDAAAASDQVEVVGRFDPSTHEPIVYPAAVVRGHARPEVLALLAYLRLPAAAAVFARHGFAVLNPPDPAPPRPLALPRQTE